MSAPSHDRTSDLTYQRVVAQPSPGDSAPPAATIGHPYHGDNAHDEAHPHHGADPYEGDDRYDGGGGDEYDALADHPAEPRRRGRRAASGSSLAQFATDSMPDAPPHGERWSTWDGAQHGPVPRPDWVITALGAVDAELGVLKTGKEADVHVVRRWIPGTPAAPGSAEPGVLMAAKRYRSADHRMFHRDAGYLEGRRVRRSRETRAMARRTSLGKELISAQWASAEFEALGRLWQSGLPVPYPVQIDGRELLMEFVGRPDGIAAPRLSQCRLDRPALADVFEQCRTAMTRLAEQGWAHGDLSAYNMLLHEGRLVLIDWPQIVDVIGNPNGPQFLQRDAYNVCGWFASHGLERDADELFGDLMARAAARW